MASSAQAWAKLLEAWGTPAERIVPPAQRTDASTQDEGLGRGRQALDMACRQHVGALLAAASKVRLAAAGSLLEWQPAMAAQLSHGSSARMLVE